MASQVQNLLGQCRSPLVHRGPIQVDYTRPGMSLIDPESGKFQFPKIEDIGKEEDEKPPPEDDQPPPPDRPLPPFDPPQDFPPPEGPPPGGGENLGAGDYIEIINQTIHLKHRDRSRGALGRNCTFQNGVVRAVDFRANNIGDQLGGEQRPDSHILIRWNETEENKTVLEYGLRDLKTIRVVTNVAFYPDGVPAQYGGTGSPGILVEYKDILAWEAGGEASAIIPIGKCEDENGGYPPAARVYEHGQTHP